MTTHTASPLWSIQTTETIPAVQPTAIQPTAIYTVEQAASALSLHPCTLRRLLRCGALKARKLGGWRISGAALLKHFA